MSLWGIINIYESLWVISSSYSKECIIKEKLMSIKLSILIPWLVEIYYQDHCFPLMHVEKTKKKNMRGAGIQNKGTIHVIGHPRWVPREGTWKKFVHLRCCCRTLSCIDNETVKTFYFKVELWNLASQGHKCVLSLHEICSNLFHTERKLWSLTLLQCT